MPLVKHYLPKEDELNVRAKYETVVRDRETSEELVHGPFKVTTIENPLQLVSQFVSAATLDKYHIWMGDRLVIASASSYMAILQDWQLVLDIDMNEFESSRWAQLFLERLENIRNELKSAKRILPPLENLIPRAAAVLGAGSSRSEDGQMETPDDEDGSVVKSRSGTLEKQPSEVVVEELYENQRSGLFGDFSASLLLPTDSCGPWSDANGNARHREDFELPKGSDWRGDWRVDVRRDGVDKNGWEYAVNWNMTFTPEKGVTTFVRRRRWIRERATQRTQREKVKQLSSLYDIPEPAAVVPSPSTPATSQDRVSRDLFALTSMLGWKRGKTRSASMSASADAPGSLSQDSPSIASVDSDREEKETAEKERAAQVKQAAVAAAAAVAPDVTGILLGATNLVFFVALVLVMLLGKFLGEDVDSKMASVQQLLYGREVTMQ